APMSLKRADVNDRVFGMMVSGNYFTTLGARPLLGRTLQATDEAPEAPLSVVLSHAAWTRRYGSDPDVLGQPVTVNGHAPTIVGVMPPSFRGVFMGMTPDVWAPLTIQGLTRPEDNDLQQRGARFLFSFGRLAPGSSLEGARSEMNGLMRGLAAEYPA